MKTSTKVAASDRASEVERFDNLAPTNTTGQVVQFDGTDNVGATVSGTGDVVGPGSSTDNAIARFDGATGKLLQNSTVLLDDVGRFLVPDLMGLFWPDFAAAEALIRYDRSADRLDIASDLVANGSIRLLADAGGTVSANRFAPTDTGGAGHVLKQASAAGVITSGQVTTADIATKLRTVVDMVRIFAPHVNEKHPIMRLGDAYTLVKVTHKTNAGTCPFNLEYHSTIGTSTGDVFAANKTAGTTQTDETTFTDGTGAADAWLVLSIEATPSTDCGYVDIAVEVTID